VSGRTRNGEGDNRSAAEAKSKGLHDCVPEMVPPLLHEHHHEAAFRPRREACSSAILTLFVCFNMGIQME
jgi:hypothetical protein